MKSRIMNKIKRNQMIFTVLLMMVICLIASIIISVNTIGTVVNDDNRNMATLLADNIYNEICIELKKIAATGQTMSASTELKDVLVQEADFADEGLEEKLKQVLSRYSDAIGCNTAFLISTATNRYFTQDGFNKVIDIENDEHDIWYKLFMESGNDYSFDIDIDEAHGFVWTVFINNRIYDDDGNLVGVCGIGTQMADMQGILKKIQEDYGISVSIVDRDGVVQVDMDDMNIDKAYLDFVDLSLDYDTEEIHYIERKDGYIVTKYMPDIGWTLLIQRQVNFSMLVFEIVAKSLLVMAIIYLLFLGITTYIVKREDRAIKRNVMLESYGKLADIHDGMYIINISDDSISEIKSLYNDGRKLVDEDVRLSVQRDSIVKKLISDSYIDKVNYFFDFSNVTRRFAKKDSTFIEVISRSMKWYRIRLVAVKDYSKNVVDHVILLIEDVDDERRKEESLRLESETAKAASDAKGRFLANMSHEIRTPINAVLGMDTMILRESNEKQIKEYAMIIQNAGNTLLSLINDILDISKIESGKMEIVPAEYDFSKLVCDVMNMISLKAEKKGLLLNLIIDKSLPSGLYGDDVRIRQIIVNLMNNAIKYTEQGGVTLEISGSVAGDMVRLNVCVKDTGIGIKEEDLGRLFEDFVRIDEARNRNIEGTGLGMSITIQLLELMNSKLEVASVYGEGSEFFFTLEQKIVNQEPVGDIKQRLAQSAEDYEYTSMFVAPDAKILVVDDNSVNRMVFKNLLKETEVMIEEADGGRKALELVGQTHYDIIFLDHMMPDMDGIEVMKKIKNTQNHPNVSTPVVALTANAISGAREEYIAAGFADYLSKPIIPEDMERMLERLLSDDKKVTAKQKKVSESAEAQIADRAELPAIEGIDWHYARLHLANDDILLSTLKNFAKVIELEADNLKNIYDSLMADTENKELIDLYRIKVHSMKSTATLLGFVPIAGMAATLEYAARDNKLGTIKDMTAHFIDSWSQYREKLDFIADADEEKLEISDNAVIIEYVSTLKSAMQILDINEADAVISNLNRYKFDGELNNKIGQLSAAVTNFDVDLVLKICDDILVLLGSN